MNLKEYAAQHTQAAPQAQAVQDNTLDTIARLTQAEAAEKRLSLLSEQVQAAIDTGTKPAAILQQLTGALFGADSPQAAAIAAAIKATEEKPAALELQLAAVRAQKTALNRKHKQQADALAATAAELDALTARERELTQRSAAAAGFDEGLADVLTLYKVQQLEATPGALDDAERLYQKYKGRPAAMAVLHSCLLFLQREQTAGRVQFQLPQLEQFARLLQQTAEQ